MGVKFRHLEGKLGKLKIYNIEKNIWLDQPILIKKKILQIFRKFLNRDVQIKIIY